MSQPMPMPVPERLPSITLDLLGIIFVFFRHFPLNEYLRSACVSTIQPLEHFPNVPHLAAEQHAKKQSSIAPSAEERLHFPEIPPSSVSSSHRGRRNRTYSMTMNVTQVDGSVLSRPGTMPL